MTHFSENFLYFFFGALALFSWWLVEYTGITEAVKVPQSKDTPDYFSKGYTKWEMDEAGKLKSKLVAEAMTHFVTYWSTHAEKPIISFMNPNTPPWVIESDTGILSNDGKKLQLNGKVTINREQSDSVKPLTINTSNLMVQPETSYAETKAWSELISPPHTTTGLGMNMIFKEPVHLELLANVKGRYESK